MRVYEIARPTDKNFPVCARPEPPRGVSFRRAQFREMSPRKVKTVRRTIVFVEIKSRCAPLKKERNARFHKTRIVACKAFVFRNTMRNKFYEVVNLIVDIVWTFQLYLI